MSPLMQQTLEQKALRRKRLMELSYPEKVRIVQELRAATLQIQSVTEKQWVLKEVVPAYGNKKD